MLPAVAWIILFSALRAEAFCSFAVIAVWLVTELRLAAEDGEYRGAAAADDAV
jgi:hypothetical protein